MKLLKLSALHTGRLYTREISVVLIYVRDWVYTGDVVQPEGLYQ